MYVNNLLLIVLDIKREYKKKIGEPTFEKGDEGHTSCLERWLDKIEVPFYTEIFSNLKVVQLDEFVLIKYKRYDELFDKGDDGEYHNANKYLNFWDLYNGIYQECRGVVIDLENECYALLPFDKFFNINEVKSTAEDLIRDHIIHASCVEFSDKMDGSMQSARWYNGKLLMAGSGSLDKENSIQLAIGYKMVESAENYIQMLKDYPGFTFIFELIHQSDAHVVEYTKEQEGEYLIGMRNMRNGNLLPYHDLMEVARKYNVKTTQVFDTSLDEVMDSLDTKKSNEKEGFVVYIDGYLLKIKYNDYVLVHKVLSKFGSINATLDAMRNNTLDDLRSKLPTVYKKRVEKVAYIVYGYIGKRKKEYEKWLNIVKDMPEPQNYIFINKEVQMPMKGWLMGKVKYGREPNFLEMSNGRKLKLKDMGVAVEDYGLLFDEETDFDEE